MTNKLTVSQIKNIAETVIEKLSDSIYDPDIELVSKATAVTEETLESLDMEWSDSDVDAILEEIEIEELNDHRKEVLYVNKIGTYASLGLSQSDFI